MTTTIDPGARLVEVPAGWSNHGDFALAYDGMTLEVRFGELLDLGKPPKLCVSFDWVRSFRYISEATYGENEQDRATVGNALLSEHALPDAKNPSSDYYGSNPDIGKGPPRLFRIFHYKAGLIEVVASDWCLK